MKSNSKEIADMASSLREDYHCFHWRKQGQWETIQEHES